MLRIPTLKRRLPHYLSGVLLTFVICATGMQTTQAAPPSTSDLPDIGTPADEVFSRSDEYQIGSMVARELREAGRILDDPETTEYIQAIGASLSSRAPSGCD